MYGRSARIALAILTLFTSAPALAKTQNFDTGIPLGIGFVGGFEPKLGTDFAGSPAGTGSDFGHYFLFEPFLDLVNIVFRASVGYHFYPLASGPGADSHGLYRETSQAGGFDYGARLQLVPLLSKDLRRRAFMVIGLERSLMRLKNSRAYSNGSSFTEHVSGTATVLNVGLGAEAFLLENYSLQIESGYTERVVGSLKYDSANDDSGATQTAGTTATTTYGDRKTVHLWGPYLQLGLNLNF